MVKKLTGYNKEPHWGEAKSRDSDNAKVWIDNNDKIKKITGWEPKHNIENGLKKTIKWFNDNLYLHQ